MFGKENFMKKVVFGLLVGLLVSCVSLQDRTLTREEMSSANIVGRITKKFTSYSPLDTNGVKQKAYTLLYEEARKKYQGNIEIANISLVGSFSFLVIPLFPVVFFTGGVITPQTVTAYADVISFSSSAATGVEGALARAADETLKNVTQRSKIAIVYITAQDRSTTEYIVGELEFLWVNKGYFITDRSQLDRLRREQNFQMSGEVDDATAVSIGKFAGADIIVTGRVDGEGNLRRLRLRALNTQTAQVVGVASERL
jgi:hypothetical protein